MHPIFQVDDLVFQDSIYYPKLSIQEGQRIFLCGESGCGKSTLLKLLNATLNARQGTILYRNQPLSAIPTLQLRKEVLLVSQAVYLFEGTIAENFKQYYDYREEPFLDAAEIKKYLKLCCLDYDLDTSCVQLSGGERQRVFIAIGLSFMPKVLMLDEPTSALDEKTAYQLFENITTFCKDHQMTLIAITHEPRLADAFADYKIVLKKARLSK